jgi:hypothetical protein
MNRMHQPLTVPELVVRPTNSGVTHRTGHQVTLAKPTPGWPCIPPRIAGGEKSLSPLELKTKVARPAALSLCSTQSACQQAGMLKLT